MDDVTGEDSRWQQALPERWGYAVALGVVAALSLVDLTLGPAVSIVGTLVAAPFLASAVTSPRRTLIVSVVTTVVATVGTFVVNGAVSSWTAAYLRFAVVLLGCALAPQVARTRLHREQRLQTITRIAEAAQAAILHDVPPVVGNVATAARYQSATADARVGGDLYDVVRHGDEGVRLIVGDVRGKGLGAVRTAARTLAGFREIGQELPLSQVVDRVDRSTSRELSDEDFVTGLVAEVEPGAVRVANCGHLPPLLILPDGAVTELTPSVTTRPFGLHPEPSVDHYAVPGGGRLLFFSDGLVEARDGAGNFFPLFEHAGQLAHGTLDQALGSLMGSLKRFSGSIDDDIVLLALEAPAGTAPPTQRGADVATGPRSEPMRTDSTA